MREHLKANKLKTLETRKGMANELRNSLTVEEQVCFLIPFLG